MFKVRDRGNPHSRLQETSQPQQGVSAETNLVRVERFKALPHSLVVFLSCQSLVEGVPGPCATDSDWLQAERGL